LGNSEASTTSQCATSIPLTILYTSADFMVTLLPVRLFVAVVMNNTNTLLPLATIWSSSLRIWVLQCIRLGTV
jgi:hypothetical protein